MKKIIFINISGVYSSIVEEIYYRPEEIIHIPGEYLGKDYRYLIVNVE